MANYTPTFTKPYPSGWVDKPSKTTPATAAIMNSYDTAIAALEAYLRDNAIKNVSADTTVKSGTKTATIMIDGTEYIIYSPSVSYESAITGGTKVGTITVGANTFDVYAPTSSTGGSTVSVVPKTLTGTNIAEITVDGTTYQLYAPNGSGSGSTVTAEATLTEGTQIGKITIDGTETILYAPTASPITVDSELSTTSENAVQNKAIAEEFQKYENGTKVVAKATEANTATTASNSEKVNGHTVGADVPSNAVFTDTVYDDSAIKTSIQNIVNGTTQVGNATKATQDAQGNVIDATYAKKTEVPQGTVVDDALSSTSTNPVQNKVVKAEFDHVNSNLVEQKMLGWTVPRECPVQNEVNGNQFVQKVGRADMSKLDWITYSPTGIFRFSSQSEAEYKKYNIKRGSFAYLRDYNYVGNSDSWAVINNYGNKTIMGVFVGGWDDGFILTNSSYTDSASFKKAMQGQYLYYELATPITRTIDGNEAVTQLKNDLSDLKDGTTPVAKAVADEDGNNIKSTYVKKTEVISGSIVDSELSETSVNPVQNKIVTAKLNEVFQSVSSGKSLIASAITDKGITTAADATFQVMADNIGKISISGSAEVSNPLSMIGNHNFKSKIVLADELSADNIAITKDSTSIQITSVEKTSDTKFKVTGDFSVISAGDVIKVQTNPGFFFDSNLRSISDVSVVMGDPRFKIDNPDLASTIKLGDCITGYYAYSAKQPTDDYWAIGMFAKTQGFIVVIVVSTISEYACAVTSNYINTPYGDPSSLVYDDGKTYYFNTGIYGAQATGFDTITNNIVPIYKVDDPNFTNDTAGWTYMAKKLLDFYFGKEEFQQ